MFRIGITSSRENTGSGLSNTLGNDYLKSVSDCGGCPIIIPISSDKTIIMEYFDIIDGIIISGGEDISPELYNETNEGLSRNVFKERDTFEFAVVNEAIKRKIPVLGICRGMQILNIFSGGSLYQDINIQRPGSDHHANIMTNRAEIHHDIIITGGSYLSTILNQKKIPVNSRHHQGIKTASSNFKISATASDGVIEAIEDIKNNIIAVQWHPENIAETEKSAQIIISDLIQRIKINKKSFTY